MTLGHIARHCPNRTEKAKATYREWVKEGMKETIGKFKESRIAICFDKDSVNEKKSKQPNTTKSHKADNAKERSTAKRVERNNGNVKSLTNDMNRSCVLGKTFWALVIIAAINLIAIDIKLWVGHNDCTCCMKKSNQGNLDQMMQPPMDLLVDEVSLVQQPLVSLEVKDNNEQIQAEYAEPQGAGMVSDNDQQDNGAGQIVPDNKKEEIVKSTSHVKRVDNKQEGVAPTANKDSPTIQLVKYYMIEGIWFILIGVCVYTIIRLTFNMISECCGACSNKGKNWKIENSYGYRQAMECLNRNMQAHQEDY